MANEIDRRYERAIAVASSRQCSRMLQIAVNDLCLKINKLCQRIQNLFSA